MVRTEGLCARDFIFFVLDTAGFRLMLYDAVRCLQLHSDRVRFSRMLLMLYDVGRCKQMLTDTVGFSNIQKDVSGCS